MSYHLDYVEKSGKFDEVVEQDGVKVLIDSKALFSIIGSEMDWTEDRLSSKFTFRNPNVVDACGCGESFNVGSELTANGVRAQLTLEKWAGEQVGQDWVVKFNGTIQAVSLGLPMDVRCPVEDMARPHIVCQLKYCIVPRPGAEANANHCPPWPRVNPSQPYRPQ